MLKLLTHTFTLLLVWPVRANFQHMSVCNGDHMRQALELTAYCRPRPTVVALNWTHVSHHTDQMTPTHVETSRCDGGCSGQHGYTCRPLTVRMVEVPVMLAKCGINSGICDKECSIVHVEEHLTCGCGCHLRASDCGSDQVYLEDRCTCECSDVLAKEDCLDSGRLWDDKTCKCGCSQTMECSTGFLFDSILTCSCVPENAILAGQGERAGLNELLNVNGDPHSGSHGATTSLEVAIIAAMLTLILILFIIVCSLLVRIRRLRRIVRIQRALSAATANSTLKSSIPRPEDQEEEDHRKYMSYVAQGGGNNLDSDRVNGCSDRLLMTVPGGKAGQGPQSNDLTTTGPGPHQYYAEMSCSTPSSGFYSDDLNGGGQNGLVALGPAGNNGPACDVQQQHHQLEARIRLDSSSSSSLYSSPRVEARLVYNNRISPGGGVSEPQQPPNEYPRLFWSNSNNLPQRIALPGPEEPAYRSARPDSGGDGNDQQLYHSVDSIRTRKARRGNNACGDAPSGLPLSSPVGEASLCSEISGSSYNTINGNCCLPTTNTFTGGRHSMDAKTRGSNMSTEPLVRDPQLNDSLLKPCRVPDHILRDGQPELRRPEGEVNNWRPELREPAAGHEDTGLRYEMAASHHIDEALRLLQESANQL